MWNASLIVLVGISQKKILTLLYTQSVILGEKIYKKRYISLKKKIYINQNITQSLESLMSQLFHDWFKSSFTSLSIKLDFILKIKFHMCSEKYKHSSFHSNFKHKNIFFFSAVQRMKHCNKEIVCSCVSLFFGESCN